MTTNSSHRTPGQLLKELLDSRGWTQRVLAVVLNASETAVSNRAARYLAWLWARRAPHRVRLYRLKGLGASHDIIEPMRSPANLRRVYPPLLDLVTR